MKFILNLLRKLVPEDFFLRLWWHRLIGFLAALIYRFPGRRLKILGITGTDGKSSTVELAVAILEEQGLKVGVASTIRFQIGEKRWKNETHKTTLGRFALQKLLRQMVKEKCDIVVIEVSSHALLQGRLIGIPFIGAVITNLTPEHLDFHRNMENYSLAKQKLFKKVENYNDLNTALALNSDDQYFSDFSKYQAKKKITFSLEKKAGVFDLHLFADKISLKLDKTCFTLNSGKKKIPIELKLLGDFSVYNALAATALTLNFLEGEMETKLQVIKKGLEKVMLVSGRMELVDTEDKLGEKNGINLMIDFGLTPDACLKLYLTLRKIIPMGKIISVFGACGNRDRSKRPKIGKIAHQKTDLVIICDDESYGEDLSGIREEIIGGIFTDLNEKSLDRKQNLETSGIHQYDDKVVEIPLREQAIEYAVNQAKPGDLIVVTGIGDFKSRMLPSGLIPWNEREVLRMALRKRFNKF